MEFLHPTSAEVIEAIRGAFAGVSRADRITLYEACVAESRNTPDETLAAALVDDEATWQDVPPENLAAVPAALLFVDSVAFR